MEGTLQRSHIHFMKAFSAAIDIDEFSMSEVEVWFEEGEGSGVY